MSIWSKSASAICLFLFFFLSTILFPNTLLARHRSINLLDVEVAANACPNKNPITFRADLLIHEEADTARVVVAIKKKRGRLVRFVTGEVEIPASSGAYPINTTVSTEWDGKDWRGRVQKDGAYIYSARAFLIKKKKRNRFRIRGITKRQSGKIFIDCVPPQIQITSPADGLTTDQAQIKLTGVISDNRNVQQAVLVHNGVSSPLSLDAQGGFSVPVALTGGLNVIAVSTTDTAGNQSEAAIQVTRLLPPEITFSSKPTAIISGQAASLVWSSQNADSVSIDQGIGKVPINGTYSVSPTETTTYTITATGKGGTTSAAVTVTVYYVPTVDFGASKPAIIEGESTTLTWSCEHADTVTIDHGVGDVGPIGTVGVSPTETTTYTITATGKGGTTSAQVTVTVYHVPTVSFDATQETIIEGESVALIWNSEHADTVTLEPGIGEVGPVDTLEVSPTETTIYTITATGKGGTTSAQVTVTVYHVPTVSFGATQETITEGETVTLTWSSEHADTVTLEPGIGEIGPVDTLEVSPTETTIYTITATGKGGTTSAQVTVTVYHVPTVSFIASEETVIEGESVTLTWTCGHTDTVTIDHGLGEFGPVGTLEVLPTQTTTYTITATGNVGSTSAEVTVVVYYMPTVSFSASKETINEGESVTLTWSSENVDTVTIDPDMGDFGPNGAVTVTPVDSTTYSITAFGDGGSAGDSVTVEVLHLPVPPTVTIEASPSIIDKGSSTTLSWDSADAHSAYIDNGIGTVDAYGTVVVSPNATTLYTITVSGQTGSSHAEVLVQVSADVADSPKGSFGDQYRDFFPPDASIEDYDPKRFSLITGLVYSIDDEPLADVRVGVLGYPEYGHAITDEEGRFTLPVEGGGVLTAVYRKDGFISAQRNINVRLNDIAVAETIQMISEDPIATAVEFDGNPDTVITHQSSEVIDEYGSRSTSMVFTGDNRAFVVDEAGNDVIELGTIVTRATEFPTPESMPAILPPSSAFTFCAELSVDGVQRVRFEKPVITWVHNFLGFTVGQAVPVGFYDRDTASWKPSNNGVVVRLLDFYGSDGLVDSLDSNGTGTPNDLNGNGSYLDEVTGLDDPQQYPPGATFWRVPVTHFSPWDFNWPFRAPADAIDPNSGSTAQVLALTDTGEICKTDTGSYVDERNRIFHDDIPIPGTDLTLHYSGDRVPGHNINIVVPASGDSVPNSLKRILVDLQIAGRTMTRELDPLPNQIAEFLWDGTDLYGRTLSGKAIAHIRVGFEYDNMYFTAGNFARSFGQAGVNPTGIWARIPVVFWLENDTLVNVHKGRGTIAEGWNLSNHHYMSPVAPTVLFKGDGTLNQNYGEIITTFAGNGVFGFNRPDGILATKAELLGVEAIALDNSGNLLLNDSPKNSIRVIDKNGILHTRFNASSSGYINVDPEDNVYIINSSYSVVQKIDPNGNVIHVAGAWRNGFAGDGGPATSAWLNGIAGIAFDAHGNTYISDYNNHRIRKIDTNGIISTIAGTGQSWGPLGDGGPALNANLYKPGKMVIDQQGAIYFLDGYNRVRKIDTSGIISTVAGNGTTTYLGDGVRATETGLDHPTELQIDFAGNLYLVFSRGVRPRILKMDTNGILTTVVGNGVPGFTGDGGPANQASLNYPTSVSVGSDGTIYVMDRNNSRVRKVAPLAITIEDMFETDTLFVDDSGMGFVLSETGHHKQTIDMDTRATLFEFAYDPDGHLETIMDRLNDSTVIERDSSGVPTGIVSPDGLRTSLTIDSNNHLTRITYPDGSYFDFEYTDDDLLTAKTEPEGNRFEHLFDSAGQLTDATDDAGGHWQFGNYLGPDGEIIAEITTGEGDVTTYVDTVDAKGSFSSTIIAPDGSETLYTQTSDEMNVTKSLPCGMYINTLYDYDSEYATKYPRRIIETTSDGLMRTTQNARTYQDTNADNIPDRITETVTVNDNQTVLRTENLLSRKTLTSPEGRTVTTQFDPAILQTLSVQTPGLLSTDYDYDARGRVVSTTTGTRSTSFTYNAQGFLNSSTGPEGHTTTYDYDDVGRLTQVSRPDGGSVGFSYDLNGNMTVLTTPVTVDHGFSFNGVNLQTGYDTPLSGRYSFVYDRDRRLKEIGFPSGRRVINEYENGRLVQTQTPEGLIDFTYSCSDKIESIFKGPESITYGYDGKLVTSESYGGTINQSLTYIYNNFDVIEMTYAGVPTAYAYDNDGLLINAGNFEITRDPDNGLPDSVTGGDFSLNRTFNGYAELEAETTSIDGVALVAYSVVRDDNGRIIQKTETVGGNSALFDYEYDAMGRLLKVWKDSILVEEYRYDLNGTRVYEMNSRRGISGRSFVYDDEDRLLEAGDASYQYDLDGFLTSKTDGQDETIYQYSSRGELLRVDLPGGRVIQYLHDPLGRRIAKVVDDSIVEKYLWQGLTQLLAVFDGNDNLLMRFEYADGRMPVAMTREAATYYLGYDQVGSLKAISDSAGNVVKTIEYDSFGNIISETEYDALGNVLPGPDIVYPVPFGFAGGLHDREISLVRFGYRDYDPDVGRWTAKDPIFFGGGDSDLYGYLLNDSINWIDPYGLKVYGAANAGLLGVTYSASTQNPSEATLTTGDGVIVGGSLSIGYDFGKGIMGSVAREIFGETMVNIGFGRFLGISFTPNLSKVQFNFGISLALPASITVPIADENYKPIDATFGDNFYDFFHDSSCYSN